MVKSQVAILVYHQVENLQKAPFGSMPIKPQDFDNQIRYLTKTFEVLPLDKLVEYICQKKTLPAKAVVLTLDDGYKDNYIHAYPILKKYNVPATIFLTTGHIGTGNLFWWDKIGYIIHNTTLKVLQLDEFGTYPLGPIGSRLRAISRIESKAKNLLETEKGALIEKLVSVSAVDIPENLGKELTLSWDEVREMNQNGIAFGAHGVSHAVLTKLPPQQARYEIIQSKRDIEDKLGRPVSAFCYPNGNFGDFNAKLARFVKDSGFACAVTSVPRMVSPKANLYELGRISSGWNSDIFKLTLSGLYPDSRAILSGIKEKVTKYEAEVVNKRI